MKKINQTIQDYLDAKSLLEEAKATLLFYEEKLVNKFGCKDEGAESHSVDEYKVTITGRVNRKIDKEKWEEIKGKIPDADKLVKYTPEVVVSAMRDLRENFPSGYVRFSACLTATPGKPSVSVTIKGE